MSIIDNLNLSEPNGTDTNTLWSLFGTHIERLPFTWPKTQNTFNDWIKQNDPKGYPRRFIIRDSTFDNTAIDSIVGIISADHVNEISSNKYQPAKLNDVNISYSTTEAHAGKGIASFALKLVTDMVLQEGYSPVLRIAYWNKASMRVAQKCGYILEESAIVIQYEFDEEPTLINLYRYIDK